MPYKDPEKLKAYKREWYQRKKAGLITRTRSNTAPTQEEKKRRQREYGRRRREKLRKMISDEFGLSCSLCGYREGSILHRKDGAPHKLLCEMGI